MPEPTSMVWAVGNFTAQPNTYFVCVTADNAVITLPSAARDYGRLFVVKNTGAAKKTTVQPTKGQTIDGAPNYVLTKAWEYVSLRSDGTNWLVMI